MSRYQFVAPRAGRSMWQDASDTFSDVVKGERQRRQQNEENKRAERTIQVQEDYVNLARTRDDRDATMDGFGPPDAPTRRETPQVEPSSVFGQPAPADGVGSSIGAHRLGPSPATLQPHTASGDPSRTPTGGAPSHGEIRTAHGMVYRPELSARRQEMDAAYGQQLGQMRFGEDLAVEREGRAQVTAEGNRTRRAATFGAVPGTEPHRANVLAEDPDVYNELYPEELDPRFIGADRNRLRFQSSLRIGEERDRNKNPGPGNRTHLADVGRAVDDTRSLLTSEEAAANRFVRPELPGLDWSQDQWAADSTAAHGRAAETRGRLGTLMNTQNRMLSEVTDRPGSDFGVQDPSAAEVDPYNDSEMERAWNDPEYAAYLLDPRGKGLDRNEYARRYNDWMRRTQR